MVLAAIDGDPNASVQDGLAQLDLRSAKPIDHAIDGVRRSLTLARKP